MNWIDPRTWLIWTFHTDEPGEYQARALVRTTRPVQASLGLRGKATKVHIPSTGGVFQEITLGEIRITEAGEMGLSMRPVAEFLRPYVSHEQPLWDGMELEWLELVKRENPTQ